jgi:phosphate transport system substrate-binding protein
MTRKLLALSVAAGALSIGVAQAQTTINGGGSSLAYPVYSTQYASYTAANPSVLFSYEAVGSGGGQKAFFGNDITQFENPPSGTLTYGTIAGSTVDFGASDAFLTSGQFGVTTTGQYSDTTNGTPNLSATDGPVIQIPAFGTPITIAFTSPTKTVKGKTSAYITSLKLTDPQICGIFSGAITDWHTLSSTIPAGTQINVAYRSDSSGTTFLLTNHFYDTGLGDVCNSTNAPNFTALTGPTKVFASLFTNSTPPASFTGESGSGGVQSAILATPGTIGYLSPDYTSIATKSPNYNKAVLTASVVNANNGTAYTPSSANTHTGLANPAAESTNLTPPATAADAANPYLWVPNVPATKSGYPIVGYTNEYFSECYADKTVTGPAIIALLYDTFKKTPYTTDITNDGFAADPSTFVTAINDIFTANTKKFNLNIDGTECAAGGYIGR